MLYEVFVELPDNVDREEFLSELVALVEKYEGQLVAGEAEEEAEDVE